MIWRVVLLVCLVAGQDPAPSATATLKGQVTDALTGAPIPRAVVTATRLALNHTTQVMADDDGRFTVAALEPDRYVVRAAGGAFRATHVPERLETPLELAAGSTRVVSIALKPGRALEGRVLDEAGLPLAGVTVAARAHDTGSTLAPPRRTNDLGTFRIFGLPAGRYMVCTEGALSPTFGPSSDGNQAAFLDTCYSTGGGEPAAIEVTEFDVEGLQIMLPQRRTHTIRGTVLDATGAPAPGATLEFAQILGTGSRRTSHQLQTSEFAVSNVAPGRYSVLAAIGSAGHRPADSRGLELGMATVEVTSDDVTGLTVMMRPGAGLRGRLILEEQPPAAFNPQAVRVSVERVDISWTSGRAPRPKPATLDENLVFQLTGLFGPYLLRVSGLPQDLVVKAIRYRGTDINGMATEFESSPRVTAEIVLTSRGAELSGRALDDLGAPRSGAHVVVLPADPRRWHRRALTHTSIAREDGTFRVGRLVAGDYLVAALDEGGRRSLIDHAAFERFARIAERVTLFENDRRTRDLYVRSLPSGRK